MTAPFLYAASLTPESVDSALREWGGFSLDTEGTGLPWQAALEAAYALFALPRAAKVELAIERSPHFRGWSEMHNERDWREQLHLGRERPAAGSAPPYLQFDGPNLWPATAAWRVPVGAYMDGVAAIGESLLRLVAQALGLEGDPFAKVSSDGYVVMKLIGYHPQALGQVARPGVAPHVDFSWLTLTLQDSPGLEVRSRSGSWTLIEPRPGALWVHAGELLEFATRGRYAAAPHRVVNQSLERTRVSIPFFSNPPLHAQVPLLVPPGSAALHESSPDGASVSSEHVHRVLVPEGSAVPFHFGEGEYRRKALNGWCARCSPLAPQG